ncbi:hypothetical protein [Komarekiella delphini-convector]|nr:hypothetical protein [Komarekiella delphini-convector]
MARCTVRTVHPLIMQRRINSPSWFSLQRSQTYPKQLRLIQQMHKQLR